MWALGALLALASLAPGHGRGDEAAGDAPAAGCGEAELACRAGGGCVRLDAWCDGVAQCADGSDEPAGCTVCNRTYTGRAGVAYALALRGAPRVPFLCHLTFTAGGGAAGDLVQLVFEEFRVGRYEAGALDGCPDGYMQLAELGRPFTGGSWCGASAGAGAGGAAATYYSETATVTVSVKLFRARLGEPFAFRLRYKFLSQRDAVVRFGGAEAPLERGAVSPGTYCTRTYEECHRKRCRLQSPNYPGMYPRNVTCYWSLRQKDIPTCKHAMISVRQEYSHKMQIKRSIQVASMNKTGRVLRAWRECTGERDRLIVYDGGSTDDPVLLEYCGGDWLPRVAARGPDMLVAFHSSPYSAPPSLQPASPHAPAPHPHAALRGFELDVDVIFADSDSYDYAREPRRCEFHVKASSSEEEWNATAGSAGPGTGGGGGGGGGSGGGGGAGRGRRGVLRAPTHTLPPNTTCTWTFHGRPGDLIWIYFSSFTHYSLMEQRDRRTESSEREEDVSPKPERERGRGAGGVAALRAELGARREGAGGRQATAGVRAGAECAVRLRLWDGGGPGVPLVGNFCDTAPALCARAALANATRIPRPCAPPDGYVSSAGVFSLSTTSLPGTATHPLSFSLHYEFVDARLSGTALTHEALGADGAVVGARGRAWPSECARLVAAAGEVRSPRNALWFGRGGARRLRCVTRLQGAGVLRLHAAAFGRAPRCVTRADARSGRLVCQPLPPPPPDPAAPPPPLPPPLEPALDVEDETTPEVPHLWIYDSPWPGYRVPVACLCDNSSAGTTASAGVGAGAGGVWTALGGALELELRAERLAADEDHRHVYYRGRWGPDPAAPAPDLTAPCAARRRLPPPGQHLHLIYPYEGDHMSECGESPFLLEARGNRSVFLRVWGDDIPPPPAAAAAVAPAPAPAAPGAAPGAAPLATDPPLCYTANRVLVYDAHTSRLVKAICPGAEYASTRAVQVRSEAGGALLVVWAAREPGAARLHWLELWRAGAGAGAGNGSRGCAHACAALGACMDGALWCDGAEDCPGGGDEAAGCGAAARLLRLLGGAGGAAGAAGAGGAAAGAVLLLAVWRRRRRKAHALPAARRLTEELLYDPATPRPACTPDS